jgi:hypothetical protein
VEVIKYVLTQGMLKLTKVKEQIAKNPYKKFAVQRLNEAFCFVSRSMVADSFVLRNRQLLVAANRYVQV